MKRAIRILTLLTIFTLAALSSYPQNTRRGFKLLEKTDLEKARELFTEALEENKDNPAAVFGLMLILADDSSAYFDLISAWHYGSSLSSLMEKFTTEDLEYIGEYFYNTEARHVSRPVKKKIEYAVETVDAKLIKYIREENNLELVYRVLKEFPDFKHYDNVIHIRNQLEFRKYEKQNTLDGYLEFIKKFPEAAQIEKAKRYINKLAFEKACKINSPEAYKTYIRDYPGAAEVNPAIKKLHAVAFEAAKKKNTVQALDEYMAEFPDALEIYEASLLQKQLLYDFAKKIQTLEAYNEFIRKYPEGQHYIDIFNLKSLDNGMRYLSSHPVSDNIIWARSFEEEGTEELSSCITIDTLNNYIAGSTVFRMDTGFTDAWIIKMNSDGKMLWNKYVGESYNDEINLITTNNRNEIFGAGYTWSGKDSSSRESWIFKLGANGTKLWSRKLGKMQITGLLCSDNGSIYAGGYLKNDSLQDLYSVVVLNDQGKRLWARTYTGKGRITVMEETGDGKIILTGTGWFARIDPKGYISGEYRFSDSDSMITCQITKNDLSFLAVRDSVRFILLNMDASNKLTREKTVELPEVRCHVNSVINAKNNKLAVLITYSDHQSINLIDTLTGKVLESTRLPAGTIFQALAADRLNNILVAGCKGEVIILKNNGITF
ncbi:MAG TPA: hypothetical protein VHI78_12370 [Bacteroidales bacterium]|nr:hypothetical protein [Bacteroidales bacterium]